MIHFLHWPTAGTYACGANAVGRRNTGRDTDPVRTTCTRCKATEVYKARLSGDLETFARLRNP